MPQQYHIQHHQEDFGGMSQEAGRRYLHVSHPGIHLIHGLTPAHFLRQLQLLSPLPELQVLSQPLQPLHLKHPAILLLRHVLPSSHSRQVMVDLLSL